MFMSNLFKAVGCLRVKQNLQIRNMLWAHNAISHYFDLASVQKVGRICSVWWPLYISNDVHLISMSKSEDNVYDPTVDMRLEASLTCCTTLPI